MTLERKPILNLDDWENALDEQITKYSSVFEVDYNQEYVIKVIFFFNLFTKLSLYRVWIKSEI